jgi:hypothetical protein
MSWKITAALTGGGTVEQTGITTEKKAREAAFDVASAGIEIVDGTGFLRYPPRRILSIAIEEEIVLP